MLKTILNCFDNSDRVHCMMKTRQNNDVTDHTGAICVFISLNCHIRLDQVFIVTNHIDAVYLENEIKLP